MESLRLGIVGCGAISTLYHLPALRACKGIELVAVVDRDVEWAGKVARRFGAKSSFADHAELVGRVDAVLVATPNATHRAITCDLLTEGIHVLCEKPLAPTPDDARHMYATARDNGTRLMAAHCLRFNANLRYLKRLLEEDHARKILSFSGEIGGPYDQAAQRTDFRRDRAQAGGGVLIDLGVHLIDLSIWLMSEAPAGVDYVEKTAEGWEVETDVELQLDLSGHRRSRIAASYTRFLGRGVEIELDDGWARAPLYDPSQLELFMGGARICYADGVQEVRVPGVSPYTMQLQHFRDCLVAAREFDVRESEVVAGLEVVRRCYTSATRIDRCTNFADQAS